MESLTIFLKSEKEKLFLIELLKNLKISTQIEKLSKENIHNKINEPEIMNNADKPRIEDFAGIWENREITLEKIREKAWKRI
ncbi:MAG: hypothetical protein QG635_25 [Bacteroidota bacterium]|nr:hypothetical protein [Bacteroidota bacterium]